MGYLWDCEVSSPVLLWGESELSCRVAAEISRQVPVLWAFPGEPIRELEGVTVLGNSRLVRVTGTCGHFTVQIETDGYLIHQVVRAIIVFPEPAYDMSAAIRAAGGADQPLTMVLVLEKIRPGDFRDLIHQVLDLTSRGHQVYLVADEVQVGFPDGEELYQTARQAGVIFLKDTVVSFHDKHTGPEMQRLGITEKMPAVSHRELSNQTVYLYNRSLGDTEPLIIEADRLWWLGGYQVRPDYQRVLSLLGIPEVDCQEYYPFGTRRKGILAVDTGWGEPFSAEETIACIKTLICSEVDEDKPACNYEIQPDLCALCLTCYRICPHQAVTLGQKAHNLYGQAMFIDPKACFGCGRCYAECPAQAVKQVAPQVKKPGTLVLACENSGGPLLKDTGIPCQFFPCAGSIGITDILKAWEPGTERLVIMTCRDGKCQHGSGGKRLSSRVERLNRLLKSVTNPVHIEVMQVSAQDRADEIRRRVVGA
ncbi:MAG: 4Fe-4S dicluster domain-containing protein [Bacillota bacterium]